MSGRTVLDQKVIHVLDLASAGDEFPLGVRLHASSDTEPLLVFHL